jgi:hypothetical protein
MCIAAELRAVDLSSSHQFDEEIGTSSSENGFFIPKMEFSVRTGCRLRPDGARLTLTLPALDLSSINRVCAYFLPV